MWNGVSLNVLYGLFYPPLNQWITFQATNQSPKLSPGASYWLESIQLLEGQLLSISWTWYKIWCYLVTWGKYCAVLLPPTGRILSPDTVSETLGCSVFPYTITALFGFVNLCCWTHRLISGWIKLPGSAACSLHIFLCKIYAVCKILQ